MLSKVDLKNVLLFFIFNAQDTWFSIFVLRVCYLILALRSTNPDTAHSQQIFPFSTALSRP